MIMRAAEKLGLRENTLFIITADHSFSRDHLFRTTVTEEEKLWARQESQQVAYFHGKAVYVRKGGSNLFRSTMNIPFVMIPPHNAGFRPGKISSTVSTLDAVPTFLDLVDGTALPRFSGKSFKKLLMEEPGRDGVFSPFIPMTGRFQRAFLLDGRYKYSINLPGLYRYREEGGKKLVMQQEYLYDLAEDPGEINNLALDGKNPELLKRMRKLYREKFIDYPDKNFIQITPFADGRAADYRITVQAAGGIIHPRTFLDALQFTKQGTGSMVFSARITDKPGILSFETDPPGAPLEISVYRDGKLLPGGEIYSSLENINVFGNPIRLTGLWDFHVARDHARTGLEAAKVPPGAVHYCRIPLNYWLEMSKSDKDIKLSPGIKEVLRGWGYIQ